MTRKTAAVIPYYQEEPGILRGAVESAIAQEGVTEPQAIVIDDGSPAPARDDLKDLDFRRRQLGNLGLEALKNVSCCRTIERYLRTVAP